MGAPQSSQGSYHVRGGQKINCLHLQWDWLALCPSTAMWGSPSCPTPQEQAPRHPTSGKAQETFCGQISQLEVYQLLVAGPQVIYPIGLNGHNEPIITTLPEPLDSGISLIASEHIYLGIDIPSSPVEEPDQKMLPLEDIPTILITSPSTSPPKSEGSMTTEVSNVLSQAVLEASSCECQHSSCRGGQPQQWSSHPHHGSQRICSSQLTLHPRLASMRGKPL